MHRCCTITQDNSVFGKVGVTITAAAGGFSRPEGAPEGSGPKEIAKINFQTVATPTLPSTDFTIGDNPTTAAITEIGTPNALLGVFVIPARIVFAQGLEGDVATRNAGSGVVDAGDVVQVRRFVTGLDTPVATHNEFQRADTAPAATKGDGALNATDVIQARRYAAGLDGPQSAGGAGQAPPMGPIAPPADQEAAAVGSEADARAMSLGSVNAVTGSRVSVPVEMTASGDEIAASFTIRYDDTRLANPTVAMAGGPRDGVTLTANAKEPGVIRVLIDSNTPFGATKGGGLIDITFDVLASAPSGDTPIEIEDTVISDAAANSLKSNITPGRISIAGPNPMDFDGAKLQRREPQPEEFDIIEQATGRTPFIIIRRKSDRP